MGPDREPLPWGRRILYAVAFVTVVTGGGFLLLTLAFGMESL